MHDDFVPFFQVLLTLSLCFTLAFFPFLPPLLTLFLILPVSPEEPEDKDGGGREPHYREYGHIWAIGHINKNLIALAIPPAYRLLTASCQKLNLVLYQYYLH